MSKQIVSLIPQAFDSSGNPLNGGFLFIYLAGTSTKASLYSDKLLATPISNPVTLNSRGEPSTAIWVNNASLKLVLANSTDTDPPASPIWTRDDYIWGLDDITDNNGNIIIKLANVSGAVNSSKITNAATGNPPRIGVNGEVNIGQRLDDSNGNKILELSSTGSSTNSFKMTNKATGVAPVLQSAGESNIGMDLNDSNSNEIAKLRSVASAVNELTVTNAATGNSPSIKSSGETDVPIKLETTEGSRTNSNLNAVVVSATTSGTPAAGIGTGIRLDAESADENPSQFGAIAFIANDVTAGSEDTLFRIFTRTAGAALAAAYDFLVTSAFKYTFTGAPSANRTITLPDSNLSLNTAFTKVVRQVFTANGTYTPTTGMVYCDVEVVGGGASGGAAKGDAGEAAAGGGGGGGAYSRSILTAAQIGASQAVTVGAGGAAASAGANDGNDGSASSLGVLITANGGTKGLHDPAFSTSHQIAGGAGGTASGTGDFKIPGEAGQYGWCIYDTGVNAVIISGKGGNSFLGMGGQSVNLLFTAGTLAAGVAGSNYGAGGSGGVQGNSATGANSGAGSSGVVIITEYVMQ